MRVLVLYAHPVPESFGAAIHETVVASLKAAGHEVDDCDLYAEGFDPVLSREERRGYHDTASNTLPVAAYVERVKRAEALVLCFPVWNFGYPAILKGFLDRVFLPGVSFEMVDGKAQPALHNIRRLVAVTSYGGSRWRASLRCSGMRRPTFSSRLPSHSTRRTSSRPPRPSRRCARRPASISARHCRRSPPG